MSCEDPIAVVKNEGRDRGEDLRWKKSVDEREPVQDKADGCVQFISILFNLRDLRRIRFGLSGRAKSNSEIHKKYGSGDHTHSVSSPQSNLVRSAWRSRGIDSSWPGYVFIEVGCRDLCQEGVRAASSRRLTVRMKVTGPLGE